MTEIFTHRDMAGAEFLDVNLRGAVFDDVNLEDTRIHNANLANVVIENANIHGLTILGIRVDELIEAEFVRRDPERLHLWIGNTTDPAEVWQVMKRLDAARAVFYARLRAVSQAALGHHRGPDRWSALEHARHLVFAEDLYLNRWLLRNNVPWCRLGFLPPFLEGEPAFAEVGSEPTEDLEAVLAAWDRIHAGTTAFVREVTPEVLAQSTSDVDYGQGTVGKVLQGMAQHDLVHIRMAEEALEAAHSQTGPDPL